MAARTAPKPIPADIQDRWDSEAQADPDAMAAFMAKYGGLTPQEVMAQRDPSVAEIIAARRRGTASG